MTIITLLIDEKIAGKKRWKSLYSNNTL